MNRRGFLKALGLAVPAVAVAGVAVCSAEAPKRKFKTTCTIESAEEMHKAYVLTDEKFAEVMRVLSNHTHASPFGPSSPPVYPKGLSKDVRVG